MADQTLASMTAASSLLGTELFYAVQGGGDAKVTATQISSYVLGTISGDATVSFGSLVISNQSVTYGKMQNVSAASVLLGRGSAAGAGSPQEITLGTHLSMSGTTLDSVYSSASGSNGQVQFN